MSSLPIDILTNILLRLPAKSLLRFKSVCKSWYIMIDDSELVNRHVEQCNKNLIFWNPAVYTCDYDTFENPRKLIYPFMNWEDGGLFIVGSCRGLICFSMHIYPYTTYLYNPTTQSYKPLPYLPEISTFHYPKGHSYMGFGYDHLSEDYKCVKIFLRKSYNYDETGSFKSLVMVYSLKYDSWKRGNHDVPFYIGHATVCNGYSVFLNGILHWSIDDDHRQPLPIFGFKLSDETFCSVPIPDWSNITSMYDYKRAHIGVTDDGCLCAILNCYDVSSVWIMKEYGVATSWTYLCSVVKREVYDDLRPLFFSEDKRKLFVLLTLVNVAYIDMETREIINVQPPDFKRLWGALVCLENLLVFWDGEDVPTGTHQLRNRNSKLRLSLMLKTERYSFYILLTICIAFQVSMS
ncbi:F-box protein CPR1 [Bienertia sinuspersici]